ncbi:SusC/RagA family TonB-linked outer membrane protein [Joostella sp.]|uniref:SusC/RagA family TonB-linked outer membrane protein n=1 Tax=Joostella sp. TaxID=2231138 RepID=UPI003A90A46E
MIKQKLKMKPKIQRRFSAPGLSFLLMLIFCSFSITNLNAQNQVSGTVTDGGGVPLPGVNVIQKGTNVGVVTDFDGSYNINLSNGEQTLTFSYIGFESKEVAVASQSVINVSLTEDVQGLDEVVVIGYGQKKKVDVIGAVGSVDSEELNTVAPVDVLQGAQGRVAGVQVISNGGPGSDSEIYIRGISTFGAGSTPLYIVDGQQVDDISNLNPSDVKSMDILKDGASAAIYGSKSANGVVLITTKQGKPGHPKMTVDYISSVSFLNTLVPVSNTRQWNKFESLRTGSDDDSGKVEDSLGIRNQLVVDVQDEIKQLGVKNQLNLAFSGGSDKAKFYWNSGYLDETGIIRGSGYKRITTNLKVDFDLNKFITAGTRINGTYQFQDGLNEGSVFRNLSYRQPNVLLIDFDGSYIRERYGRTNPIARADLQVNDDRQFRSSVFNYVQFNIAPFLTFKTTLGFNYRDQKLNQFNPQETVNIDNGKINGSERHRTFYDFQNENFFNFQKTFNEKHNVSALLGFSVQKWWSEYSELNAIEFNNDYIHTFNNVQEYNLNSTGTTATVHSLSSVFGRVEYDFDGKYLISGSIRRDGSSRFGQNKKWGNFPAIQAGWRISEEGFMDSLTFLDDFKLRASYAITGNERIGDFESIALYQPGYYYNSVNGFAPTQLGNADLGWEETAQQNYGVDLSMFKRRLNITVDRYIKTTEDLLYQVPIPQETGFSSIRSNIGSVENKGWEIGISAKPIRTKNFTWSTNFNISYNENEVLELADEDGFETGGYLIEEGESLGNMYGYENLGVFRYDESNAFTPEGAQLTPNFDENQNFVNYTLNGQEYSGDVEQLTFSNRVLKGGDIIFKDLNGDFNIDAANDRTIIGNGFSDFSGGFSNRFDYKGFSFSFLFNYNFGNDIYRNYDHRRDKASNSVYAPSPDRIDDAWVNQGDITRYPSLESSRANNRSGFESNYVSDGDFISLKNIRIGYDLSKQTLEQLGFINRVSLNVTVNNLLMLTNYEGYNPELGYRGNPLQPGWDSLRYPNKTEIILGLNLEF